LLTEPFGAVAQGTTFDSSFVFSPDSTLLQIEAILTNQKDLKKRPFGRIAVKRSQSGCAQTASIFVAASHSDHD
jgi:hypothetical protein